ncbi:MAG: DUF6899 family protein [Promethearchaeota archaeon]
MPYLNDKKLRKRLNAIILGYGHNLKEKGALNYLLFKFAKIHCHDYNDFKNLMGELEMCKQEIYRRLAAPYEDIKIKENGDVE